MPVEIEMHRDNRVILYRFIDPMDLSDFADKLRELRPMYDASTHLIHRIIDCTQFNQIPPNFILFCLKDTNLRHIMSGSSIVVTNNTMVISTAKAVFHASPSNSLRLARHINEAWVDMDAILAREKPIEK